MYRHVPIVVPVAIAAFAACAAPAAAQSFVWDNEAGDYLWFEGMNWDPDGVPTGADAIAEADDIIVAASQLVDVNSIFSTGPGLRLTGLASLRVQGLSEIVGLIIDTSIITDITANGPLLITGPSEFNSTVVFNGGSTVAVDSGVFNEGFFADTDVEITGNVTLDPRAGAPGGGAVARSADVTVTGTLNLRPGSNVSSGLFPARWNLEGTFALDGTGASVPDAFVDASILTPGGTVRARNGRIFFSGPYNYSATTIAETGGEIILEGSSGFLTGPDFQGEGIARIRQSTQNFGTINNEMTGPVGLLIESPNLELSGNLVSSGTLSLGNTVMSGSGNLLITGGITRNAIGNPTLPRTELSGGTFEISANNKFNTEFVINGGTLDAKPGAILGDSSNGFPVLLQSGNITIDANQPANTDLDIRAQLQVSGGLLLIEAGEVLLRNGSTWSGGEANFGSTDTGAIFFGGFLPHTFNGGTTFNGRGILALGGALSSDRPDIVLSGDLTVGIGAPDDRIVFTRLRTRITGPGQLTNTGYLLVSGPSRIESDYLNAGLTTLASQLTVEGELVNAGVWEHRNDLTVSGAAITNAGLWTATQGSINDSGFTGSFNNVGIYTVGDPAKAFISHRIGTRFNNVGALQATNAEVNVALTDQIDLNGRLTGGNWSCGPNGRIRFQQNLTEFTGPQTNLTGSTNQMPETRRASRVSNGATRTLTGNSTLSPDDGKVTVDGATIEAEAGTTTVPEVDLKNGGSLKVAPGAKIDSSGPVRVGEPPANPGDSVIDQIEGVIGLARPAGRDDGETDPPAIVSASLIELHGVARAPAGVTLELDAPVTAFETATWDIDAGIAGTRIEITGPLTLAGTLRVTQRAPIAPGTEITLIDAAAGISGEFDGTEVLPLPGANADVRLALSVEPTAVRLIATCPADFAVPLGQLTFADIGAFLASFNAGTPDADLAEPFGQLTFADISVYLASFVAGCT
jgi:hypothetical protein